MVVDDSARTSIGEPDDRPGVMLVPIETSPTQPLDLLAVSNHALQPGNVIVVSVAMSVRNTFGVDAGGMEWRIAITNTIAAAYREDEMVVGVEDLVAGLVVEPPSGWTKLGHGSVLCRYLSKGADLLCGTLRDFRRVGTISGIFLERRRV